MQTVTGSQMREIDRIMREEYAVDVLIMMEYVGMSTAQVIDQLISEEYQTILVLTGPGYNGGDALVAARHLANWNYDVTILLASPENELKEATAAQLAILKNMKVNVVDNANFKDYDFIIDGLLGVGLRSNPTGKIAELILDANSSGKHILAVDVPSGLDCDTGEARSPCIKAQVTVTAGLVKQGLMVKEAKPYVGRLFLSYLSIPDNVYKKLHLEKPFTGSQLLVEVE